MKERGRKREGEGGERERERVRESMLPQVERGRRPFDEFRCCATAFYTQAHARYHRVGVVPLNTVSVYIRRVSL